MPNYRDEPYDDRQADVCRILGIEPVAWQVGGRTLSGEFFWSVLKSESSCRAYAACRVRPKPGHRRRCAGELHSHLIFAQYPKLDDLWALEAMRKAPSQCLIVRAERYPAGWWVGCMSDVIVGGNGERWGPARALSLAEGVRDMLALALGVE